MIKANTVEFVTADYRHMVEGKPTCMVWGTAHGLEEFLAIAQYILDDFREPEKFYCIDPETHVVFDFYRTATEHYGLKRNSKNREALK